MHGHWSPHIGDPKALERLGTKKLGNGYLRRGAGVGGGVVARKENCLVDRITVHKNL